MFFIVYSCFAMFFYNCFTTLLYNVSFSYTVKWISYMYTCVPQDMEATYMSINRWVDKENVVHIYNGILLSHKKKKLNNTGSCDGDMDGPRVCQVEWSKSERGKQISYVNAYM